MQKILEAVLPSKSLTYELIENESYNYQQQNALGKWSFITPPVSELTKHLSATYQCEKPLKFLRKLSERYQRLLYTAIRISAPSRRCKPLAFMLLYSSQQHALKDTRLSGERNVMYDPKEDIFILNLNEDKRPGGNYLPMPSELTKYIVYWISMLRPAWVYQAHPYFFTSLNGRDGIDPQRTGKLFITAMKEVFSKSKRVFDQRMFRRWCASYGIASGLVAEYAAAMNHHPHTARQIYAPETQETLSANAIEHYQRNVLHYGPLETTVSSPNSRRNDNIDPIGRIIPTRLKRRIIYSSSDDDNG
ncbi:hypothetical protein K7432_018390 [Basidiobolus ranarum]|uniref:Tyr recombinase domain-containing protein n=1 Tax=Basidiobolus ranarum TaxID=34480 RepID=A0ABR2VJ93_9FUNG